jgi:ubiquitin conjugation factor E4 B
MSSQFYDKFNIRYNISQILKCVWEIPLHREKVIRQSMYRFVIVNEIGMLNSLSNLQIYS